MRYSGERKVTKKLISCVKREEQKGEGRREEGEREEVNYGGATKVGKVGKVGQTLYTFIFTTLHGFQQYSVLWSIMTCKVEM